MAESTYIPEGKLEPFVKLIWYSHDYEPPASKERVLPSGSSQLIINLGAEEFRHYRNFDDQRIDEYDHTIITGIHSRHLFLDPYSRISTMGVVFRPGGIQALLNLPADEFQNQVIPLGDIITSDLSALRERLIEVAEPKEKFYLLKSFLISLLDNSYKANPTIIMAARQVNNQNGIASISDIADTIGCSRRYLSGLFRDAIGTGPKEYARIQRFQQTLRTIRAYSEPDWSRIAHTCGYYDQSHFNREFKALSGLTPTEYFGNKTDKVNHLPV